MHYIIGTLSVLADIGFKIKYQISASKPAGQQGKSMYNNTAYKFYRRDVISAIMCGEKIYSTYISVSVQIIGQTSC